MAMEMRDLLDHVKLQKVHGVAHDWDSFLLSRLATYYPDRIISFSFLATAFMPPGRTMNVDATNALARERLGYEVQG